LRLRLQKKLGPTSLPPQPNKMPGVCLALFESWLRKTSF
ncbi:uncharacterized protein METZ01_LOCUS401573, partial [marine metagenome]